MERGDSRLFRFLVKHPVLTLLLLTLCFMLFGALSLDLARLLLANARFIAEHGWLAVQDAALMQGLELTLKSLLACMAWTGLKLCEHALVQRLAHHRAG